MNRGRGGLAYMPPSLSDEHGSPKDLFYALNDEFAFTVDCASTWELAKCSRFISPLDNALDTGTLWGGSGDVGWLNPPYGEHGLKTRKFMLRAYGEVERGLGRLVVLAPAKTSARWWHDVVMVGPVQVRFIRGRLTFEGSEDGATGAHVIVIYEHDYRGKPEFVSCDKLGRIIDREARLL